MVPLLQTDPKSDSSIHLDLPPSEEKDVQENVKDSLKDSGEDLSILDNWLEDFLFNPSSSSLLERQNFLQVVLPFTESQRPDEREKAVNIIDWLIRSFVSPSSVGVCVSGNRHLGEEELLQDLGRVVGRLILCCAPNNQTIRFAAADALRYLYKFTLQQRSKRNNDKLGPSGQRGQSKAKQSTMPPHPFSSARGRNKKPSQCQSRGAAVLHQLQGPRNPASGQRVQKQEDMDKVIATHLSGVP
ncbi:uncharacterized protein ACIBXB_000304 [Morphnus guianensis]